jgi:hypothetical protein
MEFITLYFLHAFHIPANIGTVYLNEKGVSFMKTVSIVFSKLQFKLPIGSLRYRHF